MRAIAAEKRTMRKLTILLAVAALAATSTGCVGRCKNWFHKGSPCGTMVTSPAMLSAPVAMGAPFAGPVMQPNMCCEQQQPMCVPCDPCMQYDPCGGATGVSSGYFGSYLPAASDCGCANGGATMESGTMIPSAAAPAGSVPMYPSPGT
jgi:hypothetical protein